MSAKLKCSECGTEISNFNMSWGRRQWLLTIPILLLGFFPLLRMTFFKGDISKDLVVSEVKKRESGGNLEVIGLITNKGNRDWSGVTVEAEFFDPAGAFLDESTEYLGSDVLGAGEEHFKIVIRNPDASMLAPENEMVVKIAGGRTSPF